MTNVLKVTEQHSLLAEQSDGLLPLGYDVSARAQGSKATSLSTRPGIARSRVRSTSSPQRSIPNRGDALASDVDALHGLPAWSF